MDKPVEQFSNSYDYILQEKEAYRTNRVPLATNWRDWNMFEHIDRSYTLKNSRFYKGNQDYTRPFNNIILPIASVAYRTEGFDVKDAQIYVDNNENYHKSFMARYFHKKWALKNGIDKAIDESVESYFDYGLTLVKNVNKARPEVVPLQTIAFCDQTDIMSGPLCLQHNMSVGELMEMKDRWDSNEIDKAVMMARSSREAETEDGDETETPGKYLEVYELHGYFPESWLGEEKLGKDWEDTGKYVPQMHIVTYYVSPDKQKNGITLFKGKEPKPIFKALQRDPIFGRACGRGGIEELFHPQIWTNLNEIHIHQMLEATSKVLLKTNKKKIVALNNMSNVKNGQILDVDDNGTLDMVNFSPTNKPAFDRAVEKWEQNARTIGAASDPSLGLNPVSGTPLGTTEIVTSQGLGIHEYRRGQIADFWAEIYRDWVMPYIATELRKGGKWLEDIPLDELEEIADLVATKKTNEKLKQLTLEGKVATQEEKDVAKEAFRAQFLKGGTKRFIEIVKDEFKNLPLDVDINIAGKQANLADMIGKLNSVFRTLFTPGAIQAIQQDEGLSKLLNEILETAGLSPIKFGSITNSKTQPQQVPQQALPAQPIEEEVAVT